MATVDIVLSVYNGSQFIREQLRSVQTQSHEDWRLWVRNDGSTDDTAAIIQEIAAADPRVTLHPADGRQLGVSGGFSWLLGRLPDSARFVACCDADDSWKPGKLSLSLAALRAAEEGYDGPILVHTDLTLCDAELIPRNHSFWSHMGIQPEPVSLRRLMVENVVTGPTVLMNRSLVDLAHPIPSEVPHHDWWFALVASVFGRVIAVPESTVLYRRHAANHTAEISARSITPGGLVKEAVGIWRRTPELRRWIEVSARQAGFFLDRFRELLSSEDIQRLEDYASIPRLGFFRRKLKVIRHRALPEHGFWRNLALLLRA